MGYTAGFSAIGPYIAAMAIAFAILAAGNLEAVDVDEPQGRWLPRGVRSPARRVTEFDDSIDRATDRPNASIRLGATASPVATGESHIPAESDARDPDGTAADDRTTSQGRATYRVQWVGDRDAEPVYAPRLESANDPYEAEALPDVEIVPERRSTAAAREAARMLRSPRPDLRGARSTAQRPRGGGPRREIQLLSHEEPEELPVAPRRAPAGGRKVAPRHDDEFFSDDELLGGHIHGGPSDGHADDRFLNGEFPGAAKNRQLGSWQYRPCYFSLAFGGQFGGKLTDTLDQEAGLYGNFGFGWDFGPKWGVEGRLSFALTNVSDDPVILDDGPHSSQSDAHYRSAELRLLFYPTGDTRWRPYFTFGFAATHLNFVDELGNEISDSGLGIPFGVGVKYRFSSQIAFRFELMDNVFLGSGDIHTMNNISLTGGVEWRFGGSRRSYWPWNTFGSW